MKQLGRPRKPDRKERVVIYLDPALLQHCESLGNGNAALGAVHILQDSLRAAVSPDPIPRGDVPPEEATALAKTPQTKTRTAFLMCDSCRRKGISCADCLQKVNQGLHPPSPLPPFSLRD